MSFTYLFVSLTSTFGEMGSTELNGMCLTTFTALIKWNNLPIFESFALPQIENFGRFFCTFQLF